jgi:hypothetical protein
MVIVVVINSMVVTALMMIDDDCVVINSMFFTALIYFWRDQEHYVSMFCFEGHTCSMEYSFPATSAILEMTPMWFCRPMSRHLVKFSCALHTTGNPRSFESWMRKICIFRNWRVLRQRSIRWREMIMHDNAGAVGFFVCVCVCVCECTQTIPPSIQ